MDWNGYGSSCKCLTFNVLLSQELWKYLVSFIGIRNVIWGRCLITTIFLHHFRRRKNYIKIHIEGFQSVLFIHFPFYILEISTQLLVSVKTLNSTHVSFTFFHPDKPQDTSVCDRISRRGYPFSFSKFVWLSLKSMRK